MKATKFGVGQPVRRVEDQRLITGMGRFASDVMPDKALHAIVVRSPHAHARFRFTDLETARALKGVKLVLTHAEVAHLGDILCKGLVQNSDGTMCKPSPNPVLPKDEARHVGDAIAFVVAETVERARDAAEAIGIAWTSLPAIVGAEAALAKGAPQVWSDRPGNLASDSHLGDAAAVRKAFAQAAKVVKLKLVNNRLVTNYMETRACCAEYDRVAKSFTLTLGSQGVHGIRDALAKDIFKIAPDKVRVISGDVGGGFGTKSFMFREYPLCLEAARLTRRPVRWFQDRTDHFLGDAQGRDNIAWAEMALDSSGRFLALKVDLLADMGAYLSQYSTFIPWLGASMAPGAYHIPAVHYRFRNIFTHTPPVDAYRGAGRPEAAYLIERLVDEVARQTGKAPDAVRAKNFVTPAQMPYTTQVGRVYDSGEFEGHMRRAMAIADWAGFKARYKEAGKRGMVRGIGMATYIEACGGGGPEYAKVSLEKDGSVTVRVGTQSNGQGHETAFAQLASQHFDLPLDKIQVIQGDTNEVLKGSGTGGSRSIPVGGASVFEASGKVVHNLKELAAEKLETSARDLEVVAGTIRIAGTDRKLSFAQIAALPGADADKLAIEANYQPPDATYPNGTHLVEVEIDPDTGTTRIVNYVIVDDFGVTLNPLLLAGQVHGGVAQGIGQALLERTSFAPDGQLVSASFMDYAMPRADDIPSFHFETRNVPCKTNLLGVKGAGEAGSIGSCPAVMNAVADALDRGFGIAGIDMPATPDVVRAAIVAATRKQVA